MRCTGCAIFPYGDPTGNVLRAYRPPLLQQQGASVSALWRKPHQSKYLSQGEVFTLVNLDGFYNLEQVRERYVNGVQDLDMAWMWRRVLWTLDYAHTKGVVHGAVLPQHVMLQPAQHGIVLVDWCYASSKRGKDHQPLKAVVGRQRAWYPKYVFDKQPAMPALDIAMGARTMVYIAGGNPETGKMPAGVKPEFARYFAGILAREGDAKLRVPEVAVEFDAVLERLRGPYFPRKFRPFDMGNSNK